MRILFLLFIPFLLEAKPTICLNMIVKDESQVIRRCLDSVKSAIDYWVIVDTGSTDGTQNIIKNHLRDIPGELHESSWKGFPGSRNEALALAKEKGDYLLFMDADDILKFEKGAFDHLTEDLYYTYSTVNQGKYENIAQYLMVRLIRNKLPWQWVDEVHEYLTCDQPYTTDLLAQVHYIVIGDGYSHIDPTKYMRYIQLLEKSLQNQPENGRYVFHMAQTYAKMEENGKALEWYAKRIAMGGTNEPEIFWAYFKTSLLLYQIGIAKNVIIESLRCAHQFRPHRKEPIYCLAALYNSLGQYQQAYTIVKESEKIPQPDRKDPYFIMNWVEEYGLLFQLSMSSYYVGEYQESLDYCDQLLAKKDLPDFFREQTEINRTFPLAKLQEK